MILKCIRAGNVSIAPKILIRILKICHTFHFLQTIYFSVDFGSLFVLIQNLKFDFSEDILTSQSREINILTKKSNFKICIKTKFASPQKIQNHQILSFFVDFIFPTLY